MARPGFVDYPHDPRFPSYAAELANFRQTHEGFPEYTGTDIGVNTYFSDDGTLRNCDNCHGVKPIIQAQPVQIMTAGLTTQDIKDLTAPSSVISTPSTSKPNNM